MQYSGDPLQDFTLMRFLDRFVFRNPKQLKGKREAHSDHNFMSLVFVLKLFLCRTHRCCCVAAEAEISSQLSAGSVSERRKILLFLRRAVFNK